MQWSDLRARYPHEWLVVEALKARSVEGTRQLDEIALVDSYENGENALRAYLQLHREAPQRELYVLHTDRVDPNIHERSWLGVRTRG